MRPASLRWMYRPEMLPAERVKEFLIERAVRALVRGRVLDVLEPAARRPVGGDRHDRVVPIELGVVGVVTRGDP